MKRGVRIALMTTHVALAAGTYVLSKFAALGFASPEALTLVRALGTTFLLLALTGTAIPRPDFDGRTWAALFGVGVLVVPINQYLFLRGLKATLPSHAALLYALTPLGVLLLASLLERRKPTASKAAGVVVALAGAIVVLRPWRQDAATGVLRRGDLFVLLAVIAWVIYTVAVRALCRKHDPRVVTAWSLILGTLAMMPIGGNALREVDWRAIPGSAWLGLVWMIAITSVTMMTLWSVLLRHLHPVQVAICMNAQPPATALLQTLLAACGIAQFDAALGVPFYAGMVLVLAGVTLVQRAPA